MLHFRFPFIPTTGQSMLKNAVALSALLTYACFNTVSAVELKTDEDKLSYTFGISLGESLKKQAVKLNLPALYQGIEAVLNDTKPALAEEEMQKIITDFQHKKIAKRDAKKKAQGANNMEAGQAFLAENKKKEGVITLDSGLQYKVITSGKGKTPKATDTVSTHYRGTLIDGTEFDSSYSRGKPTSFPVNRVIAGWTEALQLMKEGDKWELYIPSNLAYGERGAGANIGPNSTLIFEIELIEVQADK